MIEPQVGSLVLDTDAASFLINHDPIRSPRYRARTEGRPLYLPFVVVAEMRFGAEIRRWGAARRADMSAFIRDHTVVESASDIGENWVAIRAYAQRRGRPIAPQDAWIAATAVTLGLPLVTHNAAHFDYLPFLQVITEPDR